MLQNSPSVSQCKTSSLRSTQMAFSFETRALPSSKFCCTADRKGHTSPFALSRSRLRAAIHSYVLSPNEPAKTAVFILHTWTALTVHELSIAEELEAIQEAMELLPQKDASEYSFQKSCRFSCPLFHQCRTEAQEAGNPLAWSASLSKISYAPTSTLRQNIRPFPIQGCIPLQIYIIVCSPIILKEQ